MSIFFLVAFLVSVAVAVFGKIADYRKSISRIENPELTPRWQDVTGRFDKDKFKRANFIVIPLFVSLGLFLYFAVHPAASLAITASLVIAGVKGIKASRT